MFIEKLFRHLIPLFLGSILLNASCTFGPPRIYTQIENVIAKPNSHTIAVSVIYEKLRDPTGINRFPNGGVPMVLEKRANFYICNIDTIEVRKVLSMDPPQDIKVNFKPWALGWINGDFYFKLTGIAGTKVKHYSNPTTRFYRIGTDGHLSEIADKPREIVFQNNSGPLPKGIYTRVSKSHNSIDVRTETIPDWKTAFRTENETGELVSLR